MSAMTYSYVCTYISLRLSSASSKRVKDYRFSISRRRRDNFSANTTFDVVYMYVRELVLSHPRFRHAVFRHSNLISLYKEMEVPKVGKYYACTSNNLKVKY